MSEAAESKLAAAKGKLAAAESKLAAAKGELAAAKTDEEKKRAQDYYDVVFDGFKTAQSAVDATQALVNRLLLAPTPTTGPKRLLEEESFCYPPKKVKHASETVDEKSTRTVMESLEEYHDVVRFTFLDGSSFIWFGIKQYLPTLQTWISHLFHPTSSVQRKQLLLVHGAVKSGKTTLVKDALPHLLTQLQAEMPDFQEKTFCFAYIDLSSLTHMKTPEEKWKTFWSLLSDAFPGILSVDLANVVRWHVEVAAALRALKGHGDALWFISLDEFHHLFSGLDADQVANLAETAKYIFLDNDSPCYFLLGGSTQATFWSAVGKAKDNGLRILHEAHIITTPFEASNIQVFECVGALVEQQVGTDEVVKEAFDMLTLGQRTPVNLTQVVLLCSRYSGSTSEIVKQAYEAFLRTKQSVFLRDYTDLPDPKMVEDILNWAHGSTAEPPQLYSHLLAKRGDLFYIRDEDFLAFLAQYYDAGLQKIVLRPGNKLPIVDIMMFVPLIPLGQLTKEQKMDETKFEVDGQAFATTHFNAANELQFKKWLIYGPDPMYSLDENVNPNYTYAKKRCDPATLSWVLVVRMLRNIFGHQKDITWQSLSVVKDRILSYMQNPINFNEFVRCYENCRL